MAKLVLSARLKPRREDGVDAEIAEFPDIKVSAWSVGVALARLREAAWQRLRWTKVEKSCAGEPISPIPQKPTSEDLAVPIDVEVPVEPRVVRRNSSGPRHNLSKVDTRLSPPPSPVRQSENEQQNDRADGGADDGRDNA